MKKKEKAEYARVSVMHTSLQRQSALWDTEASLSSEKKVPFTVRI